MEDITDFEELIDLNLSFLSVSQRNSQEPISDVLDKMAEIIDGSNIDIDNILKSNDTDNKAIRIPNEVNTNALRNINTEFLCTNTIEKQENDNSCNTTNEQNNEYGDLEEFENILAAKCLKNNGFEIKPNNIATNKQHTNNEIDESIAADVIALAEFEDISGIEFSNKNRYNVKSGLNYTFPDEFERFLATQYDKDRSEDNITKTKQRTFKHENNETLNENVIDLDDFLDQDINDRIQAGTDLMKGIAISTEQIHNVAPYEVPIQFEAENKDKLDTVTEQKYDEVFDTVVLSSDSEDGYNSSDFEFITEKEASEAGLISKFNKTVDEIIHKGSVNNKLEIANAPLFKNITDIVKSRKNEASLSEYLKYNKYRYQTCYSRIDTVHVIPKGEQYLDMFRGANEPMFMNDLYAMRSKSVRPPVLMAVNNEDFNYRGEVDENSKEHKDQANECLRQILASYPQENRRKRRRQ